MSECTNSSQTMEWDLAAAGFPLLLWMFGRHLVSPVIAHGGALFLPQTALHRRLCFWRKPPAGLYRGNLKGRKAAIDVSFRDGLPVSSDATLTPAHCCCETPSELLPGRTKGCCEECCGSTAGDDCTGHCCESRLAFELRLTVPPFSHVDRVVWFDDSVLGPPGLYGVPRYCCAAAPGGLRRYKGALVAAAAPPPRAAGIVTVQPCNAAAAPVQKKNEPPSDEERAFARREYLPLAQWATRAGLAFGALLGLGLWAWWKAVTEEIWDLGGFTHGIDEANMVMLPVALGLALLHVRLSRPGRFHQTWLVWPLRVVLWATGTCVVVSAALATQDLTILKAAEYDACGANVCGTGLCGCWMRAQASTSSSYCNDDGWLNIECYSMDLPSGDCSEMKTSVLDLFWAQACLSNALFVLCFTLGEFAMAPRDWEDKSLNSANDSNCGCNCVCAWMLGFFTCSRAFATWSWAAVLWTAAGGVTLPVPGVVMRAIGWPLGLHWSDLPHRPR